MNINKLILFVILLVIAVSFCIMISPVCVYTKECSALRPASQGVLDEQEIVKALQMSGTPSAEEEQGVNIPGPDASARQWRQAIEQASSIVVLTKLENRLGAAKLQPYIVESLRNAIAERKGELSGDKAEPVTEPIVAAGKAPVTAVEAPDKPNPNTLEVEWAQIVRFIGSIKTPGKLEEFESRLKTHAAMKKHPELLEQGIRLIEDRKKALEEAARKESEDLDKSMRIVKNAYLPLLERLTEFSKASAGLRQALDSKDRRSIKTYLTRLLEVRTRLVGQLNEFTEKWNDLWLPSLLVSPGTDKYESQSDPGAFERQISDKAAINGIKHEPSYYWTQFKKTDAQLIKLCARYQVPHNIPTPDFEDITIDLSRQIKLQVVAAIDSQA